MKDRERILELVKKGVISTEEALILLESIATEKDEKIVKQEAESVRTTPQVKPAEEKNSSEDDFAKEAAQRVREKEEADQKQLEEILARLATEANRISAKLDEVNVHISEAEEALKGKKEQIMVLDTMEELEALSEEKESEREEIEDAAEKLEEELDELREEKAELEEELKDVKKEQRTTQFDDWGSKFEIPENWKSAADDTVKQVSEKVSDAGSQLGRFLKRTVNAVTDVVNDNVDWKEINLKVPGVASTKFSHEFYYPDIHATIIDVKVANGKVVFKRWDEANVKVIADIKLYGKMDAASPFEAFIERSEIDVDDERVSFQIPNKRVKADLTFYLPARVYDHVSVKMLNGAILFEEMEAKDVYVKSTNGAMTFTNLTATMLEVEGVNGNISFEQGEVLDLLLETVNGSVVIKGDANNISATNMNGDIKITSTNKEQRKIEASVVNGSVKVALPNGLSYDGDAQTSLGSIYNRIDDVEIIREKKEKTNQLLQFRKVNEDAPVVNIRLKTTTGNIFLKESEQA